MPPPVNKQSADTASIISDTVSLIYFNAKLLKLLNRKFKLLELFTNDRLFFLLKSIETEEEGFHISNPPLVHSCVTKVTKTNKILPFSLFSLFCHHFLIW